MTRPLTLTLFALALLATACTRYATIEPGAVGPGYATGGGEWDSGGGITIAVSASERNGATVICGAWTTDRQSALTIELNGQIIDAGSVYLGGSRAVHGLGFMARVPYAHDITGAPSGCIATATPWRAEFAAAPPRVRLPRMTFPLDKSKAHRVSFRETVRPEILP